MRRCRREQWRIGSLKQAGFHATGHWQVPREELKRLLEQVKRVSVDLPLIQELWLFAKLALLALHWSRHVHSPQFSSDRR
jgi:hypothetical protein